MGNRGRPTVLWGLDRFAKFNKKTPEALRRNVSGIFFSSSQIVVRLLVLSLHLCGPMPPLLRRMYRNLTSGTFQCKTDLLRCPPKLFSAILLCKSSFHTETQDCLLKPVHVPQAITHREESPPDATDA